MKAGSGLLLTRLAVRPKRIKTMHSLYIWVLLRQSEASLVIDDIYGSPHMK